MSVYGYVQMPSFQRPWMGCSGGEITDGCQPPDVGALLNSGRAASAPNYLAILPDPCFYCCN